MPMQIRQREMMRPDGGAATKCVDCATPAAMDRTRCLWHLGQQRMYAQRQRDIPRPGVRVLAQD